MGYCMCESVCVCVREREREGERERERGARGKRMKVFFIQAAEDKLV